MEPDYHEGDFVLVRRARMRQFKRGTPIAFIHPEYGMLIKRVDHSNIESQTVYVSGTNHRSIKSEAMGPIPIKQVLGTVLARFRN
jgi:hypothetical protein